MAGDASPSLLGAVFTAATLGAGMYLGYKAVTYQAQADPAAAPAATITVRLGCQVDTL